jgi:hypothetical protein
MTNADLLPYCLARLDELQPIVEEGNPWGFVCLASFVDFLSKLAEGEDKGGDGYKSLIEVYYPQAYRDFRYTLTTDRLHVQMYHVFRCGLLHSFSLYPDVAKYTKPGTTYPGRPRSVLLTHDGLDSTGKKFAHLSLYSDAAAGLDAAILIASDFLSDTRQATADLLSTSATVSTAMKWVSLCPPVGSLCL